jgi:hypothetical protein
MWVEGEAIASFHARGEVSCGDRPPIRGEGVEGMTLRFASEKPDTLNLFKAGRSYVGTGALTVPGTLTGDSWTRVTGCGAIAFSQPGPTCGGTSLRVMVIVSVSGSKVELNVQGLPGGSANLSACFGAAGPGVQQIAKSTTTIDLRRLRNLAEEDIVLKARGSDSRTEAIGVPGAGGTVTASESGSWKVILGRAEKDPVAKAGGPYSVERAATVTLDGSKSTTRHKPMRSYRWKFAPGEDCEGFSPRGVTMTGKTVKVVPLCSLTATLEVEDDEGHTDSDVARIKVKPRTSGWRTPFSRRTEDGGARAPTGTPSARTLPDGGVEGSLFVGLNASDCGQEKPGAAIVCPIPSGRFTWAGNGYEIDKVSNPGGPFDGYSYVRSSILEIKRVELVAAGILPGSAWYQNTVALQGDAAGFLAAVRLHEGLGAGRANTGHSQIIRDEARKPSGDVRRELEKLAAPTESGLTSKADAKVTEIDARIDSLSNDPLPDIWTGKITYFHPASNQYLLAEVKVPGNMP